MRLISLSDHTNIVRMLIDAGADVNHKDKNDNSALHWAIFGGNLWIHLKNLFIFLMISLICAMHTAHR